MRKHIKIGLSLLLFAALFVSCETVEDVNLERNDKPGVTLLASSAEVSKGGSTTIGIETSTAAQKNIYFSLVQTGGNAVLGVDYTFSSLSAADYGEIGGEVYVPAYELTGSVDIIGLKTYNSTSKSATFKLVSIQSKLGLPSGKTNLTVNFVPGDALDMELRWDGTFIGEDGNEHDWCDYDLDLEIYDSNFDVVAASYSHCPEDISIAPGDLPDGDYLIAVEFWAGGDAPATNTQVPANMFFGVAGVGSSVTDLSSLWDTDTGGYVEGNADWYNFKFQLTVSGSSYTVVDADTDAAVFSN